MARGNNMRGGLVSRGKCEGCKIDLGNVLDPYCWSCARALERQYAANRRARLAEAEPVAISDQERARAIESHVRRLLARGFADQLAQRIAEAYRKEAAS